MPPESGDRTVPLERARTYFPEPTDVAIEHAARLLRDAERPLILAGNGVLRRRAAPQLRRLARDRRIPVAATFMGKGAIDDRDDLSLMSVGIQARDHVLSGFEAADLVIAVGYDLVEYAPDRWNPGRSIPILHIDTQPAEVDDSYRPAVELIGDIDGTLERLREAVGPLLGEGGPRHRDLRDAVLAELGGFEHDDGWPIKPQRAIADLRRALEPHDIVISDVGAHKVWIARLYQAYEPNTVIISNGFAAMGISVPGAIAASLVHPDRTVVALTGDGAFLMNSQELETAVRVRTPIRVVVWRDDGYGLIDWKQRNEFGRAFAVRFGNPDLVRYAESFGMAAFRPDSSADLYPTLRRAFAVDGPSLVDVPIDYAENLRLSERLGALTEAD
jgi:acetolactate synthase-1/2/3 large subunit